MKTPLPVWLFILSMLLSLNAATVQAQIEQRANEPKILPARVNDTASNVRLLSQIGGPIRVVSVAGNKAYMSEGRGITILDVSQPADPKALGRTQPLPDVIHAIVVQNNYIYVVAGSAGLHIFDISNPANPLRVGFYDTPGDAQGVFVAGNYAYVADGASGLRVVNISTAFAPSEVGFFDSNGDALGVFVAGAYAYLADGGNGLRMVNVANPATPNEVGSYTLSSYENSSVYDVYVAGSYAYITDSENGLFVINIANPTAPSEVGEYTSSGFYAGIHVAGNYAYIGDGVGLEIVNISNPAAPSQAGAYDTPGFINDIYVLGDYAYVTDGGGLRLVNIATPTSPSATGSYTTGDNARDVFISGNYAYVASDDSGIRIFNVANPTAPSQVGHYDTPGSANDIYVSDNYAYVADWGSGLRIIDVTNPAAPHEVGFYDTPGFAFGVYLYDHYAYVADGSGGLRIIDVANPALPKEVGFYDSPGDTRGVYVLGNYAYLADWGSGLQIINISNPAMPTQVGFFGSPQYLEEVYVSDGYAYLADYPTGLRIVNISNPQTPSEVGSLDTPGGARDLYVLGAYAYFADDTGGLRVIDVAKPASPHEVGFYTIANGWAYGVQFANNVIYLATGEGLYLLRYPACFGLTPKFTGLGAIPVANPTHSQECLANEYLPGTSVTVSAQPATTWHVAGWQGTNNDNSTAPVNQFIMPAADYEVTVHYAPTCYPLTLTHAGTGNNPAATPANSDNCALGQYVAGQLITLQAAPGAGSTVGSWSGTANDNSTTSQNTLTMPATPYSAGLNYVLGCYSLTLTHTGSGSDPVAAPAQANGCAGGHYHFNDRIDLSASPAAGWLVSAWGGTVNNSITAATNSLIMPGNDYSASVHYGEAPVTAQGDLYELDNTCTRSHSVAADGSEVQLHSFHTGGDVDWVRFDGAANARYRIEVNVPITSTADVVMEIYDDCASAPFDQWNASFSPGARLDISRTVSGPTYVRLSDVDPTVAGNQVRYELSVHKLDDTPTNQTLIIVAGRLKLNDPVQPNIDKVASNVYKLFQRNGYTTSNIQLFASNANLPGYTGAATKATVQAAIQNAASKVTNGVFTLYMVDHGSPELFYLDGVNQEKVTPAELNDWLNQLESAAPGVKVNVIIEACESGSFIDKPGSISKAGRVVLTSSNADNDAKASKEGAYFSDHLLTWMQQGFNLSASFFEARSAAKSIYTLQDAWLDSNGNGVANEFDDSALAAQRSFAYAGTLADNEWPPHIFQAEVVGKVSDQKVRLRVDARDNGGVRQVWAVVYEPGYTPPPASQVLQPEVLPTFLFTRVDNDNHWEAAVTGLTKSGTYRFIIQADDEQGLVARPASIEVTITNGNQVYLPLVSR